MSNLREGDTEHYVRTLVGQVLKDRYHVQELLGVGGMGSVYRARDAALGLDVVVKAPHHDALDSPGILERFEIEIDGLRRLQHQNIVRIIDLGQHKGMPYFVMEYVDGGNLEEEIGRHGPQSVDEVLDWLTPIATALDEIHAAGRLHRDIKPANILFKRNGHVLLSDFGISRTLETTDLTIEAALAPGAQPPIPPCTPSYAPPEILERTFTPAYDQYSLGTTVYFALSGGPLPFSGTGLEVLRAKAARDPEPLRPYSKVSQRVENAILKSLSRDPRDRFASCDEFREALESAAEGWDRGRVWRFAAAVLTLSTVVVGFLFAIDRGILPAIRESTPHLVDQIQQSVEREPDWIVPGGDRIMLGSSARDLEATLSICRIHSRYPDDCNAEDFDDEIPIETRLESFRMDPFEITRREFGRWAEVASHITTAEDRGQSLVGGFPVEGATWRDGFPGDTRSEAVRDRLPVTHVSFEDAATYCRSRNARLPTQQEWEYAARGPELRLYPWGSEWDATLVSSGATTRPVGAIAAGAGWSGHFDLAGNVWEWTSSRERGLRVLRGGSFAEENPAYFRGAMKLLEESEFTSWDVGFRCVEDIEGD